MCNRNPIAKAVTRIRPKVVSRPRYVPQIEIDEEDDREVNLGPCSWDCDVCDWQAFTGQYITHTHSVD